MNLLPEDATPSGTRNDRRDLVPPKLLELCGAKAVDVLFSEVFDADLRCLCLSRFELGLQLLCKVNGANLHRRRLLRARPRAGDGEALTERILALAGDRDLCEALGARARVAFERQWE